MTALSNSEERDKGGDSEKDSDSDGDGAEEILEESPCKRWSKRREQVKQRDVPGIDVAYLAMDNETGNEVVWNEVQFSERKNFRAQEEKINAVFDNLTQLVHTNLVKFHKYWTDSKSEKPRIIFITEYMSSGSMSLFLQRTRKSKSPLSIKAWKKWVTQILSALHYLHTSTPPIVHGNLSCHTVFIQQNGLIKIGCVAPEAINHHVKTCRENLRNMHYIAPEYEYNSDVTHAADIYSFGICALEIAVCGGLAGLGNTSENGTAEGPVTDKLIQKGLETLEDSLQRDLIASCLVKDPAKRPTARELLFHKAIFEVHPMKVLAAHVIVNSKMYDEVSENVFRVADPEKVWATSRTGDMVLSKAPNFQLDLEKFLEDVRNGIYPLTAFLPTADSTPPKEQTEQPIEEHLPSRREVQPAQLGELVREPSRSEPRLVPEGSSSEEDSPTTSSPPTHHQNEPRTILQMRATLEGRELTMLLKLEDMMNRHLSTEIGENDNPTTLVDELVRNGFVCEADADRVERLLEQVLSPPPVSLGVVPASVSASASVVSCGAVGFGLGPSPGADPAPDL